MPASSSARVAYVLKVYPRFSQTFVLNEILAHQAAGTAVDIFSLRLPDDVRFHEALARVRSPIDYVGRPSTDPQSFWDQLRAEPHARTDVRLLLDDPGATDAAEAELALRLASGVRARGIEHLHARFGNIAGRVARLAAKLVGISYSYTAHARDIFHRDLDLDALQRNLREASTVVTVSDFNLRYLSRAYPDCADRIELVYNGLDLDEYSYACPRERSPLILAVGRMVTKKGFSILVQACAELRDAGVEFNCEIVGDGPERDALSDRISSLGLDPRVVLVGPLSQQQVAARIRSASILAAPCVVAEDGDRDGVPTVLLEAMALGTPCVSTDVTGIPEVLRHEQTGLLVDQHDAAGLARACARLLSEPDLRETLAQAARTLIEEHFDVGRNSARLREIFADCIERRSAGS